MSSPRFRKHILLGLLCLSALVLTACGSQAATDMEEERPPLVTAAETKKGTLAETVHLTGNLSGSSEASVSYRGQIPLLVEEVLVEIGEEVKQGQVLVRLNTRDLHDQLQQAQAALDLQRASLNDARLSFESAQRNVERMQMLYAEGAISAQDWEQARDQYERARINLEQIVPAQIRQAEANLASVQNQLSQAQITAPIDGKVAERTVSIGQLVSPGSPLLRLVNIHEVFLEGGLPAAQAARVQIGQMAEIKGEGSEPLAGKVAAVSPAADSSGLFRVKVQLVDLPQQLQTGTYAEADIVVATHEDVLLIPRDALLSGSGESRKVFVHEEGKVKEVTIQIGLESGDLVEVRQGLMEGQQVVVDGKSFLSDGMAVEVVAREEEQ